MDSYVFYICKEERGSVSDWVTDFVLNILSIT